MSPTNIGVAAGDGKTTENGIDCPCPTASLENSAIAPAPATTTLVVASATFGNAFAWIVVVPNATGIARTFMLTAPAGNVTLAGTETTVVSSELKLIVRPPPGAGADKFSVKSWGLSPVIVVLGTEKLMVAVTRTVWWSDI